MRTTHIHGEISRHSRSVRWRGEWSKNGSWVMKVHRRTHTHAHTHNTTDTHAHRHIKIYITIFRLYGPCVIHGSAPYVCSVPSPWLRHSTNLVFFVMPPSNRFPWQPALSDRQQYTIWLPGSFVCREQRQPKQKLKQRAKPQPSLRVYRVVFALVSIVRGCWLSCCNVSNIQTLTFVWCLFDRPGRGVAVL